MIAYMSQLPLLAFMVNISISLDQFIPVGDQIVHAPTGSWWKASLGGVELSGQFTGRSVVSSSSEQEYNLRDVAEFASTILLGSITHPTSE